MTDIRKAAQAVFDAFCAAGSIHIDTIKQLGAPMKELGAALAQPEPEPPTLADVLDALNVFNPMEGAEQWVESDDIAVKALPKFIHSVGKAWYLAPSAQPDPMTSERHFALREAHAIGAADAYFKANPDHDDEHARAMFERGFGRGFDSHERLIAQPAPKEFDADDMQEQWTAGFNAGRAQPEQQARHIDVLRIERDRARECYDRTVHLLFSVHALLYPAPITTQDGRTLVFRPSDPNPHEILQELSNRIRALPDELAKIEHPPAQPQADTVAVPRDLLESMSASPFREGKAWSQRDMDNLRAVDALLAAGKP